MNSDLGGWQPVYIRIRGVCKWTAGPFPPSFLLPKCPSCSILDLTCVLTVPLLWRAAEAEEGLLGLPLVIAGVTGAQTLAQILPTYDPPPCRTAWVPRKWFISGESVMSFSMLLMIRHFLCLYFLVSFCPSIAFVSVLLNIAVHLCWLPPFSSIAKWLCSVRVRNLISLYLHYSAEVHSSSVCLMLKWFIHTCAMIKVLVNIQFGQDVFFMCCICKKAN